MAAIDELCEIYTNEGVCVFTGAGVSFTSSERYKADKSAYDPDKPWWNLLADIHRRIHKNLSEEEAKQRFEKLTRSGKGDELNEWDVAQELCRQARSKKRFIEILILATIGKVAVIGKRKPREKIEWKEKKKNGAHHKGKQLPGLYLQGADTLNSVIAFCSRLTSMGTEWPRFGPDCRVHAILTLNYDGFLESGATTKYRNGQIPKPMVSVESQPDPPRIPSYHLHGYIPYDWEQDPREELVLTRTSYEEAYEEGKFITTTLDEHLCGYTTLFVGLSFSDKELWTRMKKLKERGAMKPHYALMSREKCDADRERELREEIGVRPIIYDDHWEIPCLLGKIYTSALPKEGVQVLHEDAEGNEYMKLLEPTEYWQHLLTIPRYRKKNS